MRSDIYYTRDDLEVDPAHIASVVYQLSRCDLGLVAIHAGLLIAQDPAEDSKKMKVLDWPQSYRMSESQVRGEGRSLEIPSTGVVIGWVGPYEAKSGPDVRIIYEFAVKLLVTAIRGHRCYKLCPARSL